MANVSTYLMFQDGNARAAVERYVALIPGSRLVDDGRPGNGAADGEPSDQPPAAPIAFELAGQRFLAFDSPVQHAFGFTPATSVFVTLDTPDEVDEAVAALSEGGELLMPLGEYDFSPRFAWLVDRWGVSWQVSCSR